jgi:tetratricopeptide (TPR) repeat protein
VNFRLFREGNDAFLVKNYDEAIRHYSKAIELEPSTAIFYSNRRLVILHSASILILIVFMLLR